MTKTKTLDLNWNGSIANQGPKLLFIIPADLKDAVKESGLDQYKKIKVSVHLETIPEATT